VTKEEPAKGEAAEEGTLADHLEHLAATADDVVDMITRSHTAGEIHPETLTQAAHLQTSLRDVINALLHNEHLAMKGDDIWKVLTRQHTKDDDAIG
jgi:hypothetical protein